MCWWWKTKQVKEKCDGYNVLIDDTPEKWMKFPSNEECCICYHSYIKKDLVVILQCSHRFHQQCLLKWVQRRNVCPLCIQTALPTWMISQLHS